MNNYDKQNIATMELLYGEGYLSAGGDDEVVTTFDGHDTSGSVVLDLGCGLGGASIAIARYLPVEKVCGVDVDQSLLYRATELIDKHNLNDRIELTCTSGESLPFEDGIFDYVYVTAVSCHIEKLVPFFTEIHRVLKPGGHALGREWFKLNDSDAFQDWDNLLREKGLNFFFVTVENYLTRLEAAGFHSVTFRDRTSSISALSDSAVTEVAGELRTSLIELLGQDGYEACKDWTEVRARAFSGGGIGQSIFNAKKKVDEVTGLTGEGVC